MHMKKSAILFLHIAFIFACSDSRFESADVVANLSVSFADARWDGKKVPKCGQCTLCGGEGLSPSLKIANIPENTDFLMVEYKDLTMGVYHGAVRIPMTPDNEYTILSLPEQTYELPQGIQMETEHQAPIGSPGAYMAPCGCGYNNKYMAYVFAMKSEDPGKKLLLGKGKIKLGRF
jgi:phosphatidylethanolamine-binding protein (PEBP) family uncharacterized protein